MFVIVCIGWVFFRAGSIADAWEVLRGLFSAEGQPTVLRVDVPREGALWLLIAGLGIAEWLYRNRPRLFAAVAGGDFRGIAWRAAMVASILFSYIVAQQGVPQPFIYFQF
jgi:hypothetical protein